MMLCSSTICVRRDKRAENDHVRRAHVARLDGEVVGRYVVHGHVVTAGITV